ncbi:hypothetical protein L3Q82_001184 [Scortum barcoo]|uniref:Uncharacterized protein n=1 Tax=Scortum barcoo TaxID=214431 RepID=A0ACB8W8P0_9TELE|nr:hypothetical protein L3Q82_001184 [Scortum barcoo]
MCSLARGSLMAISRYRDEILRPLFLQDEGIDAMDWPTRSPDLNPIEHIWDIMSRSIHQHATLHHRLSRSLADALVQVWEEIPQETIRHLIRSPSATSSGAHLPPHQEHAQALDPSPQNFHPMTAGIGSSTPHPCETG